MTELEVDNILILFYCVARDILRELLNNLDKDISKNDQFWEEMKKKYGGAIKGGKYGV